MATYRIKAHFDLHNAGLNNLGIGYVNNNPGSTVGTNYMPFFDFFKDSTFLFRWVGIAAYFGTKNQGPFTTVAFDTKRADGITQEGQVSYASPNWPANLTSVAIQDANGSNIYGAPIIPGNLQDLQQGLGNLGLEQGTSRIVGIRGGTDTYTTTDSGGNLIGYPQNDVHFIIFEGDFDTVTAVDPYPDWQPNTSYASYGLTRTLKIRDLAAGTTSLDGGSFIVSLKPNTAYAGATDAETFFAAHKANFLNVSRLYVGDLSTSPLGMPLEWGVPDPGASVGPTFFLDTEGSAGTGASASDTANTIGSLPDNTIVQVMAGSILNGIALTQDSIFVVQNDFGGTDSFVGSPSVDFTNKTVTLSGNGVAVDVAGNAVTSANYTFGTWVSATDSSKRAEFTSVSITNGAITVSGSGAQGGYTGQNGYLAVYDSNNEKVIAAFNAQIDP